MAGRGLLRLRYVNFEHVQNIRSAVVVIIERSGIVVRSWEQRSTVVCDRIEVVVQPCLFLPPNLLRCNYALATTIPRCYYDLQDLTTTTPRPLGLSYDHTKILPRSLRSYYALTAILLRLINYQCSGWTTDAKWWQKLTLPSARWAKNLKDILTSAIVKWMFQ